MPRDDHGNNVSEYEQDRQTDEKRKTEAGAVIPTGYVNPALKGGSLSQKDVEASGGLGALARAAKTPAPRPSPSAAPTSAKVSDAGPTPPDLSLPAFMKRMAARG